MRNQICTFHLHGNSSSMKKVPDLVSGLRDLLVVPLLKGYSRGLPWSERAHWSITEMQTYQTHWTITWLRRILLETLQVDITSKYKTTVSNNCFLYNQFRVCISVMSVCVLPWFIHLIFSSISEAYASEFEENLKVLLSFPYLVNISWNYDWLVKI